MDNKFSPIQIKMLKIFNRYLESPKNISFNRSIPTLVDKLGLSRKDAKNYYILWFNNFRNDGDYELVENPDLSVNPIYDIVKKLSVGSIEEDNVDEKYMGDFHFCTNSYRERLPCISVDKNEVTIKIDYDFFNENSNISGLSEDDIHFYNISVGGFYDNYTESDADEFNYIKFDVKTIQLVIDLCEITGNHNFIYDLKNTNIKSEELADIIEEILKEKDYTDLVYDYIGVLDSELDRSRRHRVRKTYEEEVKYLPDVYGNTVTLTIPLNEFLEMLTDTTHILLKFDDILKLGYNPRILLTDVWYDTWLDDEGVDTVINEFNYRIENIKNKYEEDEDLKAYFENFKEFKKFIGKLGFKMVDSYGINTGGKFELTTNNNQKLFFLMKDVDFENNKITFFYNGEKHLVPIEELSNWAMGSVLNLEHIVKKHLKKLL